MDWVKESIVITGQAGFISSHLTDALVDAGAQFVDGIDNFSRGRRENVAHHEPEDWAGLYRGPICILPMNLERPTQANEMDLVDMFRGVYGGGSVVFHLAAKVTGIQYNQLHSLEMMQANLAINHTVTEAVKRAKPKLYIYISTACVYPHDAPVPTPEDAAEVCDPEPTNFGYGVAKWVGEQQARFLCKEYGIPTIIVRFFNAFGPRDYYDEATSHVAPALIRRVMEGENPLVVWGSGNQTRALVDARDIAKALVMLAEVMMIRLGDWGESINDVSPSMPWIVNIGHEREISIEDLAFTIVDIAHDRFGMPKPNVEFDTSKPDGYPRRAADTTRLRSLIGWVPDMPLEQTLEDMMRDYLYQKEMGWIDG